MSAEDGSGEIDRAQCLKQSKAAVLNSYAGKGYPYAAWEVKRPLLFEPTSFCRPITIVVEYQTQLIN